jgi:hypothetical protein
MLAETIPQLKTFSVAKKRRLIAELIDEVYGEPVRNPSVAAALTARVDHYRRNPGSARSWATVKARLRRKR